MSKRQKPKSGKWGSRKQRLHWNRMHLYGMVCQVQGSLQYMLKAETRDYMSPLERACVSDLLEEVKTLRNRFSATTKELTEAYTKKANQEAAAPRQKYEMG